MTDRGDARLLKSFNLTRAEYCAILEYQGGGCAICGRPDADSRGTRLAVDHDHKTGLVRGLLCTQHNRLLTWAVERYAERYAAYLADPPATAALGGAKIGVTGPAVKRRRKR